jgi:hypothetical protein
MKGGSMPSDSDCKCGFLDYNYGSPQWITEDILKSENKRKLQMRLMRSVSNAGRKKGIFKDWEETAGLTTIEMKMERPVQSWDRQQQRH